MQQNDSDAIGRIVVASDIFQFGRKATHLALPLKLLPLDHIERFHAKSSGSPCYAFATSNSASPLTLPVFLSPLAYLIGALQVVLWGNFQQLSKKELAWGTNGKGIGFNGSPFTSKYLPNYPLLVMANILHPRIPKFIFLYFFSLCEEQLVLLQTQSSAKELTNLHSKLKKKRIEE